MSNNTVNHVGRRVLSGLTAIGTGQSTAYPLANSADHQFTTVSSSTGAVLPAAKLPSSVSIWNGGSNTLSVYPPSGGKIDDGTLNAAYSLSAGAGVTFFAVDTGTWYVDSPALSGGSGTVTSVTFTGDGSVLSSTPSSAVTTTGTVTAALASQAAHLVLAGPTSGSAAAPTFRAIAGADLPNPSATTLGGVESITAVSHQWINSISTSGVPTQTQPAFTDISGTAAVGQLPVMVASGGSHAAGIAPDPGASSGTAHFLREDATWAVPPSGSGIAIGLGLAFASRNLVM